MSILRPNKTNVVAPPLDLSAHPEVDTYLQMAARMNKITRETLVLIAELCYREGYYDGVKRALDEVKR